MREGLADLETLLSRIPDLPVDASERRRVEAALRGIVEAGGG